MSSTDLAALNASCDCMPLSRSLIDQSICSRSNIEGIARLLAERPHLFASSTVFISSTQWQQMVTQLQAIEAIARLPDYQTYIAARTTPIFISPPDRQSASAGLLMGYDFHITANGPRLIEVNTNAGGAFLTKEMLAATYGIASSCESAHTFDPAVAEASLAQMFVQEWQLAGRQGKPRTIAIVDSRPEQQYLYPDMQLAAELLTESGIEVFCVDPSALRLVSRRLTVAGTVIDMVYNRLTDFSLEQPTHQLLKQAYMEDLIVLSPAPVHHAMLADKRNLTILRDRQLLTRLGAHPTDIETLQALPNTRSVTPDLAAQMWHQRKQLFFKPAGGYGGRAVYRGSKITAGKWLEVAAGGYVAQDFVAPGVRAIRHADDTALMKFDIRIYTFAGQPLTAAARVYQGQTTNFRTSGGGFAPVITLVPPKAQNCTI